MIRAAVTLLLTLALTGAATGGEGAKSAVITSVDVHPARVDLSSPYASVQLLLFGRTEDGKVLDVTRDAELTGAGTHVTVDERGLVRPVEPGRGTLRFRIDDVEVEVPYSVDDLAQAPPPTFAGDVMPILSRASCNSGSCHGSAQGKNGFQLSLRGYDPVADFRALTDDLEGRRVDRVVPARSLFLLKPTAEVPHEGGQAIAPDSVAHRLLADWVADGARMEAEDAELVSIRVVPEDPVLSVPGLQQQFAILATYSDGRERDVSARAFVEVGDIEVTSVDDRGLVTALRRGESAILARYEGRYAATSLFVMGDREGWTWTPEPARNWIDELVNAKLQRIRSQASPQCTDAEFLRRLSLDLTGQPPTPAEVEAFLLDARPSQRKRDEMIDRLVGGAPFVEHWTNRWCDLLLVNDKNLGREGSRRLREWVRGQVASNAPYDGFARAVLDSSGATFDNPPAAYHKVLREPDAAMENTTQLFLGVRFNCNKCHDHPFERWTRDQHWDLAAYFGQVGRRDVEGSRRLASTAVTRGATENEEIYDRDEGEVVDPDTGVTRVPAFPYQHGGDVPADGTRRARLAAWVTAGENPLFARSYVNRLWSYFLGRGIIHPVDDIRASNPPSHPELLDRLTDEFVASGFDTRALMKLILRSRTYQRSIETNRWNEGDDVNFAHGLARRLPAETLFDAVHSATGSRPRLPGARPGTRAGELVGPDVEAPDGFLGLFGRPPRESVCECERATGLSLGHALNLVNGPTVADAIEDPEGALTDLARYEKDPAAIVRELYMRFLCRPPSDAEVAALVPSFDAGVPANLLALTPDQLARTRTARAEWEATQVPHAWTRLVPDSARSAGGATLTIAEDGAVLASDANPEKDTTTLVAFAGDGPITGLRLEVLPHESLAAGGPGRAENGNFVLHELRVAAVSALDPTKTKPLKLRSATADFSQGGWPVAAAVDGNAGTGWAVSARFGEPHTAVFEVAEDVGFEGGTLLVATLVQNYGSKHVIGHLRLSTTGDPRPVRHLALTEDERVALRTPAAERTDEQRAVIHRRYVRTAPELIDLVRLGATQDLAWALVNSPAFLFNR
ncbi:MAG: DUF1549 and DUF1553 domain-containing protein [Planctomycetota bacterium]